MEWISQLEEFQPESAQEENDQRVIIEFARQNPSTALTRENEVAHITSSGLILNPAMNQTLMVHHNIYNTWTWTGGHADGETDLLAVALREAGEETGAKDIHALDSRILSIDILPVWGHVKRGRYVSAHLHLSAAYVLTAEEDAALLAKPDENSGVKWIPIPEIPQYSNEPDLIEVYQKLIRRAKGMRK